MTRVGVESCCWWGDIKLLNQLTHLLKLQPLNNLWEATQCTQKCKREFFQAYRKETHAMFSKFMETELEEIPSSPPGPCVSESSNVSILRNIFLVQNLQCPKFPLSPVPWGWTSSVRWMASPDLKEDGEQQQSKQEACRGWYCVGGKLHNTLSKSKLSSSWQQHRLTSHSVPQQPEGARAAGTKVWCKAAAPCRHLGQTAQGGSRAATDGCQGMRQHQASTQKHFPQVLS